MSFRKSSRNQNFTVVYNEVAQHETMSMEARGLLLFMLSLPEDWEYHKTWLQDRCKGWGRDKMAKILKELENFGYLIRTAKQCPDTGKMSGWVWEVFGEAQNTEKRISRQSENSPKTEERISRQSVKPTDGNTTTTKETGSTKQKSSKSVKPNARENFSDRVISELEADGLEELPPKSMRYARMKITEYQERFPQSRSVADCWSYVVQALNHESELNGGVA